jgi:hypothetical protein
MVGTTVNWENELGRRLKPFPDLLGSQGAARGVSALRIDSRQQSER